MLKEELAGAVTVQVGDATYLEFPSQTFDSSLLSKYIASYQKFRRQSRKQHECFGKVVGFWYSNPIGFYLLQLRHKHSEGRVYYSPDKGPVPGANGSREYRKIQTTFFTDGDIAPNHRACQSQKS